jgi:hypothetical protein
MSKTIEKKINKRGIVYALVADESTFSVWKLCENYNGQVRGGIAKAWRYVEKNLTEEAARKLYNRRAA